MHLPVETAATRCYDPNTAVWCDDWLRRAGVVGVEGGVAVQHIHSRASAAAPLKFKHLYKLEMDPFFPFIQLSPPLSSPISPVTHLSFHFLLPLRLLRSPSPVFPPPTSLRWVPSEKWRIDSEGDGKRDGEIKHERRTEGEQSIVIHS